MFFGAEAVPAILYFLTASKITFLGPILLQFPNTHFPKLHIQNNHFDSPKSGCSHGPRMLRVWCKRRAPELQTRQRDLRFCGKNAVRTEESEPDASKTGSTMSPLPTHRRKDCAQASSRLLPTLACGTLDLVKYIKVSLKMTFDLGRF